MEMPKKSWSLRPAILSVGAALALSACAEQEQDYAVEDDVLQQPGGELMVDEEVPGEVTVDVPDTELTPVPEDDPVALEGQAGGATPPVD